MDDLSDGDHLPFQADYPAHQVTYFIKPMSRDILAAWKGIGAGMRVFDFNVKRTEFKRDGRGYNQTSVFDVPALKKEPFMPAEDVVKSWVLISYMEGDKLPPPDKFWKQEAKDMASRFARDTTTGGGVKELAAKLASGKQGPREIAGAIAAHLRANIKNILDDSSGFGLAQYANFKPAKDAAEVLRRGYGLPSELDVLFASLAEAAGLTARPVRLANRTKTMFDPGFPDAEFLPDRGVAVKDGSAWVFYQPSQKHVAAGKLKWQQESGFALLGDAKEGGLVQTPVSEANDSGEKRVASIDVKEDG